MSKRKSSKTASSKPGDAGAGSAADSGYTVLARKYRPQTFDDLIGQDAMVRTLRNAFRTGRIAHAYMLTGVRGVGKTTTARILARALNYTGAGGGETLDMPEPGEHCDAIMESRHPDVLEIDAASHTGIDNIREIIDGVRYRPAYARHKVYIVDEVHMLSKPAFNALLKTLEEPPEHVVFIFATTEVRKVPVTVLSRCQRFDLRRVDAAELQEHFKKIAGLESVEIEDQALGLIARAAEGSVRDGLSILDQAIAHATGTISGEDVRAMLGLAERTRVFALLETVLKGDVAAALEGLAALHHDGAEPQQVLADMAEVVHVVTRIKAAGAEAGDPTLSEAERDSASALAERLPMPVLARAWQMLLKGLGEVQTAPRPLAAADMVLVRLAYAAELPAPDELVRQLRNATEAPAGGVPDRPGDGGSPSGDLFAQAQGSGAVLAEPMPQTEAPPVPETDGETPPAPALHSFADVAALLSDRRELQLCRAIEEQARLVRFREGHIELRLLDGAPNHLANSLGAKLSEWTGRRWMVAISDEEGEETLGDQRRRREAAELETVKAHPSVQAVFDVFPDAEIVDVRPAGTSEETD